MQGIPTVYANYRFRSRLEAKWARFFDLMRWKWEYEPFDANGWIPDFVLIGCKEMVLVEVKPIAEFDQNIADKIDHAEMEHDAIILGISPLLQLDGFNNSLGWLGERGEWTTPDGVKTSRSWDVATLGEWGNVIGFCHAYMSYRDRITGIYDGSCAFTVGDDDSRSPNSITSRVRELWAQAQNETQWMATQLSNTRFGMRD